MDVLLFALGLALGPAIVLIFAEGWHHIPIDAVAYRLRKRDR